MHISVLGPPWFSVRHLYPPAFTLVTSRHGPLAKYVKKYGLRMRQECPGTFSPPLRVSNPDMHHGTCVTHVPWCMSGPLTSGFPWSQWRGKRSRHSRRMRKQNFAYLVRGSWHQHCCGWFWYYRWFERSFFTRSVRPSFSLSWICVCYIQIFYALALYLSSTSHSLTPD